MSGPEVPKLDRGRAVSRRKTLGSLLPQSPVDFYNLVSSSRVVPAGGFDLAELTGELSLRLTREEDVFTALDDSATMSVDPGEIAYAFGSTVLTRRFVRRQFRTGPITPSTQRVFLVSEILEQLNDGVADEVLKAVLLREHLGMVDKRIRVRLRVMGTVQGVGYRPFVYGLATRLGLSGFVLNDFDLDLFLRNLDSVHPDVEHALVSGRTGEGLDAWRKWLLKLGPNGGRAR